MDEIKPKQSNEPIDPQAQIRVYLEGLLEQAGMFQSEASDQEFKESFLAKMGSLVQERIGLALMNCLNTKNPELLNQLEKMSTQNNQNGIMEFFQKNIPNYQTVITQVLNDFSEEFMRDMKNKAINK